MQKYKPTSIIKKTFFTYIIEDFSVCNIHQVAEHKLNTYFVCVCSSKTRETTRVRDTTLKTQHYTHYTSELLHQTSCYQFPQAECALVAEAPEMKSHSALSFGLFYLKGTCFSEPALKCVHKNTQNGLDQTCLKNTLQIQIKKSNVVAVFAIQRWLIFGNWAEFWCCPPWFLASSQSYVL